MPLSARPPSDGLPPRPTRPARPQAGGLALLLAAAALLGAAPGTSTAQTDAQTAAGSAVAGIVKRSVGDVSLERAGQRLPVRPGTVVQVGDTLRTGADGAAGLTLADDSRLSAGPGTELVLSTFRFDATTQDGQLLVSLWRGTLNLVTGLIGKKAPEQVKVQTRTVVLGVRGTEFIVDSTGATP